MGLLTVFLVTVLFTPIFCNVQIARVKYWKPVNIRTSTNFLSVALDTFIITKNFENFNMTDEKLIKVTTLLGPGYLRVGGNAADRLIFSKKPLPTDENLDRSIFDVYEYAEDKRDMPNFTMTGNQWVELNKFASKTGFKILFDLNVLIRYDNGTWNSKNAKELISFSDDLGYDLDWQLGNEPDGFNHSFGYKLSATQLAKDFSKLKLILQKFERYKYSCLVGPDTTRPRPEHVASAKYLEEFLNASLPNVLNAITFHQYYLNGHIATLEDFLNVSTFNLLEEQLQFAREIADKTDRKDLPLWLGETSTAYGGGTPGLSNGFVGSFLWLDKLGMAAKYGLKIVIRQSLFNSNYALIDHDYNPTPDWWLSVLYKELVGPEVLHCNITTPETVRLYCQCAAKHHSQMPHIAVFGVNINNSKAYVRITDGYESYDRSKSQTAYAYVLTAGTPSLTSKSVRLNGKVLNLTEENDLPVLEGKPVDVSKYFLMPPYSLAFWIVPSSNASICTPEVLPFLKKVK